MVIIRIANLGDIRTGIGLYLNTKSRAQRRQRRMTGRKTQWRSLLYAVIK
jgi:hypothetical protein